MSSPKLAPTVLGREGRIDAGALPAEEERRKIEREAIPAPDVEHRGASSLTHLGEHLRDDPSPAVLST